MTRPSRCHGCESRTVKPHCEKRGCPWVTCLKCLATTGIRGGKLWHRGGVERTA